MKRIIIAALACWPTIAWGQTCSTCPLGILNDPGWAYEPKVTTDRYQANTVMIPSCERGWFSVQFRGEAACAQELRAPK